MQSHPDITPFVPPSRSTDSVPQLEVAIGSHNIDFHGFFSGHLESRPPLLSTPNKDLQALPQPPRIINNNQAATQSHLDDQVSNRDGAGFDPMSTRTASVPGKTSSDSAASSSGLDRWAQRRLQRLHTEQGFREQRQGTTGPTQATPSILQQQQQQPSQFQQQQEPLAVTAPGQPALYSRPQPDNNLKFLQGPSYSPPPTSTVNSSPSPASASYHDNSKVHDTAVTALPAPDANTTYYPAQLNNANPVTRSLPLQRQASSNSHRSSQGRSTFDSPDYSPSASRGLNRQSIHSNNGGNTTANSNPNTPAQVPHVAAAKSIPVLQSRTTAPSVQSKEFQMSNNHEDMTEDDIDKLVQDHKELRKSWHGYFMVA